MKSISKTLSFFFVFTLFSMVPLMNYGQTCSSWIKNFSSLEGECTAIVTDSEHNMYALIENPASFLVKLDQNGNLLWTKSQSQSQSFTSMGIQNNTIVIMGSRGTSCQLYTYDLNGNQTNYREIPSSEVYTPIKMVVTNNEIFVAGIKTVSKYKSDLSNEWVSPIYNYDGQYVIDLATNDDGILIALTQKTYDDPEYYHYYNTSLFSISSNGTATIIGKNDYSTYAGEFLNIHNLIVFDDRLTYEYSVNGDYASYLSNTTKVFDFSGNLIDKQVTAYGEAMIYDKHRNVAINGTIIDFQNYCPGFGEQGLHIRDKNLNEIICPIQLDHNSTYYSFVTNAAFSDGINTYLAVTGYNFYINQFHILESDDTYFIKLTSDYCLIPNEPIYAGTDRELFCGDQTTLGVTEFNPLATNDQLFSKHEWDWIENGLTDNFKTTLSDPHNGYYHIKVTSGACSVVDSVLVDVKKLTNFSYVVSGNTVQLDRIEPLAQNFTWDFGNGITNSINPKPIYTYPENGTFSLCLTGEGVLSSCISCVNIKVPGNYSGNTLNATGINELNIHEEQLKLFPNPTKNLVEIFTNNTTNINEIILINQIGQQLSIPFEKTEKGGRINVSTLPKGIYILWAISKETSMKSKLIVN